MFFSFGNVTKHDSCIFTSVLHTSTCFAFVSFFFFFFFCGRQKCHEPPIPEKEGARTGWACADCTGALGLRPDNASDQEEEEEEEEDTDYEEEEEEEEELAPNSPEYIGWVERVRERASKRVRFFFFFESTVLFLVFFFSLLFFPFFFFE